MNRPAIAFCLLIAALSVFSTAHAFPERPLRIVVPFSAGGGVDIAARALADAMSKRLGQPVVVLNTEGAAGTIGANSVATAAADGYTLGFSNMGIVTAQPNLRKSLNYSLDSFDYLCRAGETYMVFAVQESGPYRTMADLIAAAKAKPGQISIAHPGVGSIPNLTSLRWAAAAGIEVIQVPFRGDAQSIMSLQSKTTDAAVSAESTTTGQPVRILGVFAEERLPSRPDVPTMKELGLDPGFTVSLGMFAPKGLPDDVRTALEKACVEALRSSEYEAVASRIRQPVRYLDAASFAKKLAEESANIATLAKTMKIEQ